MLARARSPWGRLLGRALVGGSNFTGKRVGLREPSTTRGGGRSIRGEMELAFEATSHVHHDMGDGAGGGPDPVDVLLEPGGEGVSCGALQGVATLTHQRGGGGDGLVGLAFAQGANAVRRGAR